MKFSLRQFTFIWILIFLVSIFLFVSLIFKDFFSNPVSESSLKTLNHESYVIKERFKAIQDDLKSLVVMHVSSDFFIGLLKERRIQEIKAIIKTWKATDQSQMIIVYDSQGKLLEFASDESSIDENKLRKSFLKELKGGYGKVSYRLYPHGISLIAGQRIIDESQNLLGFFYEEKSFPYSEINKIISDGDFAFIKDGKLVFSTTHKDFFSNILNKKKISSLQAFELKLEGSAFDLIKVDLFKQGTLYLAKKSLRDVILSKFYTERFKYILLYLFFLFLIFYFFYYRQIVLPLSRMNEYVLSSREGRGGKNFLIKEIHQISSLLEKEVSDVKRGLEENRESHKTNVNRLVASVAHELNNSLTYIGTNIDYVSDELSDLGTIDQDESISALASARVGYERMKRIVSDLKVFSNKKELSLELIKVDDLAVWISDEFKGVEVEKIFTENLLVKIDKIKFQQIIKNLILNARDAYSEDTLDKKVRVSFYEVDAETVMVDVSDKAAGISVEHRKKIFSPFYTTKKSKGGTGLGLSLSLNLATEMGSELFLKDTSEKGSIFCLKLRRN